MMFTTKFSKAGRTRPLARKFAEGGIVDPDDRRRYRKATKEEEDEFTPTSRFEQILSALAAKVPSYKKEELRQTGPVVGLGPRG
jgi:hypothetical protein